MNAHEIASELECSFVRIDLVLSKVFCQLLLKHQVGVLGDVDGEHGILLSEWPQLGSNQ